MTGETLAPQLPAPAAALAAAITAGDLHTCAVTTAGAARCWGRIDFGQASPPGDLGTVTVITAGGFHTCAVTTAGSARCWGSNGSGQASPPAGLVIAPWE